MSFLVVGFAFLFWSRCEGRAVRVPGTNSAKSNSSSYIDMHVHLACIGPTESGEDCFVSPEMVSSFKFNVYLDALGVTEDEMRETHNQVVVDRLGEKIRSSKFIQKAVLLGLDGVIDHSTGELKYDQSQVYFPNSFVLAAVKRSPDIFLYGPSINPYRKDAIERLEQAKKDGAVLVKWIPSTMDIDPADAALIPFYRKLKKLNLPLLMHTGKEETFISAKNELCDPARLTLPLDLGVTVIAAHLATTGDEDGQPDFERLKALFEQKKYKGLLFADISGTTQYNRIRSFIPLLNDPAFKDRIIYGTDWPLIEAKLLGVSLTPFWLYTTPLFDSLLTLAQANSLSDEDNAFDRDLELKRFLGVPEEAFSRSTSVLRIRTRGFEEK